MPRLSIIITFYNETAFIDMAVSSVLSQRIGDLELVIVNDNPEAFGPDFFDCLNLPVHVKVVHHPTNKGLSAARNTGLSVATAPLVGFLDADDYYVTGGLARQLSLAEDSGADVTHAACFTSRSSSPELDILRRDRLLFNAPNSGAGLQQFEETQFITSSWASLYRRDFLDLFHLRFDEEQPKFEDRLFVLQAVTAARQIATLGSATRVWRQRGGSISVTGTDPYIHRLQVQLLEKCLTHMQDEVAKGHLPPRFERRELFNTVSRLIWDMDVIDPIVVAHDPAYAEFASRIVTLLGDDSFGNPIFDDPMLTHISRVGMRTRKGFISRTRFFAIHKAMREGDFAGVQALLRKAQAIRPAARPKPPAAIDADVIVHLGMHKTGSTFLQHHLMHHRDALLAAGIHVPSETFQNTEADTIRDGASSGHSKLIVGIRDTDNPQIWQDLRAEITASGAHTVIISCENMLFPINKDRDVLLSHLTEHLSIFNSVRVMAMVRRPDAYVEALYKEIVANGQRMGSRSPQEFMVDHADTLTNLSALFDQINAGSTQKVTLLDFDAAARAGTLWETFRTACNLPDTLATLDVPKYASAGRGGTQAARVINTLISDKEMRQRVLRDLFSALPPEPDTMSILSPTERLELIDQFEENSASFATAHGYTPDYKAMRASVPQDWSPSAGMDSATLAALQQSRLRAELPAPIAPPPTTTPEVSPPSAPRPTSPAAYTLRIKLRPWVIALLRWRPFGNAKP